MAVKFNFKYEGKTFFGPIYRPVAKISFQSQGLREWTDVWMVVDTGADFTILPKYLAKELAVSLESDCAIDTTRGVGGEQTIYLCRKKVLVKLGNLLRKVPVAFFNTDEIPPLLGRLGFLETFDAEFLKSHILVFRA
ncbi:MAG: retroviral-like aspartic protease family protein [Chlamydiae bacterium]|nr:retroviral-like aspartic protease family protein [Chlamydiota bacterium]MBI3265826.1 retroviral-like aspartic protease family protein [Chlamydiota bacterium]